VRQTTLQIDLKHRPTPLFQQTAIFQRTTKPHNAFVFQGLNYHSEKIVKTLKNYRNFIDNFMQKKAQQNQNFNSTFAKRHLD
jgi:hypothetical protein